MFANVHMYSSSVLNVSYWFRIHKEVSCLHCAVYYRLKLKCTWKMETEREAVTADLILNVNVLW
jgi:hypothetical protein